LSSFTNLPARLVAPDLVLIGTSSGAVERIETIPPHGVSKRPNQLSVNAILPSEYK
jgi:hypothetical protein